MEMTFQTLGTNTYLNMILKPDEEIDGMSLGMLTNNKIPGLAETTFTQMDDTKYIRYNVSSKISAAQLFNGPVNKKRLIGVFSGIVNAMLSAEDYMLDTDSFLLDLDYIFIDVSTCDTVLICVPLMKRTNKNMELGAFLKDIIFRTQFDQTENCDHVAKIINYLNTDPVLQLAKFKDLLDAISDESGVNGAQQSCSEASEQKAIIAPEQPRQRETVQGSMPPVCQPEISEQRQGVETMQPQVPIQQPAVTEQGRSASQGQMEQTGSSAPHGVTMNNPDQGTGAAESEEKRISLMYLLQHYNKENAAKYKEQKNKKQEKAKNAKAAKGQKKTQQAAANGFAVPGAPATVNSFTVPGAPVAAPAAQEQAPLRQPQVHQTSVQNADQQTSAPRESINFGETTVLGGNIGETTVLDCQEISRKQEPYLIRTKTSEMIPITKPVFRIGKERSYVDYFISDNTAVSRSHANITNKNGQYYIMDTNSTNHTYVNDKIINSNEDVLLEDGTKVRLANEEFEFRMVR